MVMHNTKMESNKNRLKSNYTKQFIVFHLKSFKHYLFIYRHNFQSIHFDILFKYLVWKKGAFHYPNV